MQVVSRDDMQRIDRFASEQIGLKGEMLMENAGRAVFHHIKKLLPSAGKIGVMIGKGNNGGDGFVIARYLMEAGYQVSVWVIPNNQSIQGDAAIHKAILQKCGGHPKFLQDYEWEALFEDWHSCTIIIDALLGTGITGVPREPYRHLIQAMNQLEQTVVSVDIPSGTPANGGQFDHEAVQADYTITLQCPKMGRYTYPAANFYGVTQTADIGIPYQAVERTIEHPGVSVWQRQHVLQSLPNRAADGHKGNYGRGLLVAGSKRMPGAAALAARAALRSGIGLLSVAVTAEAIPIIGANAPEATFTTRQDIDPSKFDGVAIGPGMGVDEQARQSLAQLLKSDQPFVIDADGLHCLKDDLETLAQRKGITVLTPHPGEMARLTGDDVNTIESDRFGIARAFATRYGIYLVLKGPFTIITTPEGRQYVNETGNPALAKGGSGDVLTGMILALLMQYEKPIHALNNAVYLHGQIADRLIQEEHSPLDVVASDLTQHIPNILYECYRDATS
ncbi:NAD(P)H-hydrate dehydratase [Tuberibacillus sp. Marseille-P3662]|uniref:NAD(P)H-hydrate dehydratase n=1 Tax=Tuberibacillus sp. Marseille-P3662 TaxID=1965358 RepID=UPI000A1CCAF3|nr:NAD(P)H-hydrate dehydratase [Tuberibacillus sp. Marseille-P3662]